jgi:hypothetical protein
MVPIHRIQDVFCVAVVYGEVVDQATGEFLWFKNMGENGYALTLWHKLTEDASMLVDL